MSSVNAAVLDVPTCSLYTSVSDYNAADASSFDPRDGSYYLDLWRTWLPGAVLGGVAAVGMLCFLVWLFSLLCRRHCWIYEVETVPGSEHKHRKRRCGSMVLPFVIVTMLLATTGLGIWGLISTLNATDDTVTNFWEIIDTAEQKVTSLSTGASNTVKALTNINSAVVLLADGSVPSPPPQVTLPPNSDRSDGQSSTPPANAVVKLQSTDGVAASIASQISSQVQSVAKQVRSTLEDVLSQANKAVDELQSKGVNGLRDFQDDYKHVSVSVQDTWRYVVIIVFFALVMLTGLLATIAALLPSWPRTAATFTLLLWLLTALLMFLGAGAMSSLYVVSQDACLYGEAYSLSEVQKVVTSPEHVLLGMQYYFGVEDIAREDVLQKIYNFNTSQAYAAADSVQPLLDFVASDAGQTFIDGILSQSAYSTVAEQLQELPLQVNSTISWLHQLEDQVQRSQWQSLYNDSKALLCCDVNNAAHQLWLSWTATGCAALVLAVSLTIRVVSSAVFF